MMERTGVSRRTLPRLMTVIAIVAALGAGIVTSISTPRAVAAADFSIGDEAVVNTDALNLRSGPGTGTEVISVLVGGVRGTVTDGPIDGTDYTWYQLTVVGRGVGWVAGEFLAQAGGDDGFFPGTVVVVNTDALNLRAGPGIDETVVTVIYTGTRATVADGPIAADGYTWYELTLDGLSGWAAGDFLALAGSDGGTFPDGASVIVNTDALNVRVTPGITSRRVDTIYAGWLAAISNGPIFQDGYAWYRLNIADAADGWVAGEFLVLAPDDGSGIGVGDGVMVNTDALNVRADPGLDGDIITTFGFGTEMTVIGGPVDTDGYVWYEVGFASTLSPGWVAGDFLIEV